MAIFRGKWDRKTARRLVSGLALAGATFALLLLGLEVGFRLAGYQPIYDVYSKPSLFWRHDELLGWSHEVGAEGLYVGPRPFPIEYSSTIRINSQGLRGPEPPELPPDGYRILLLGDSLVAGFEVEYEDTFAALLQKHLNERLGFPVQVVNAGVRGYGTDQSYLWFRERGWQLDPDLVLFFHSLNDPENNVTLHRMRRPFGKAVFAPSEGGGLELRGHPIPRYPLCSLVLLDADFEPARRDGALARALCAVQLQLSDRSAFFTWVTLRLRRNPSLVRWLYGVAPAAAASPAIRLAEQAALGGAGVVPRYALTTALLLELAWAVRESGADFMLMVPRTEWQQLDNVSLEQNGITPNYMELPIAPANRRYLRFKNDLHLNETGHSLTARALADLLEPILRAERSAGET